MRTITKSDTVTVKVHKNELLENEWIILQLLTKKLRTIEEKESMAYKQLCNKFYNSRNCGKYNTRSIAGLTCVNIKTPMKAPASLTLEFEVVD